MKKKLFALVAMLLTLCMVLTACGGNNAGSGNNTAADNSGSNNAGGILGGITTGAPLLVRCALKPISSVMVDQRSVDLSTMEPATLRVHGRHDTTAVIRAVPVVEAVCALAVADALLAWPPQE